MKKMITFLVLMMVFLLTLIPVKPVRADVAPPEMPPGANLVPGSESTQVRMLAETVILTVSKDPADPQNTIAQTDAVFTMRNLGGMEEKMQVRFPLSFFNGSSNGFGGFPEIPGIAVRVNGKTVSNRHEIQPYFPSEGPPWDERTEIPWAVFDVTFPAEKDVIIGVTYTVSGYGYYPNEAFKYILETGAGWKGTIGSVDVIVRLPYEVNNKNVEAAGDNFTGYGSPTAGGVVNGKEIHWHFEDLEPTWENNIQIVLVAPSLWESVLTETKRVTGNPNDGEAWGRLGKAYKEVNRGSKGFLRQDPGGREMFRLSREAYEKCLVLLPNDSLWHYGYADLLWIYFYTNIQYTVSTDTEGILPLILTHLQTALSLDPNNQKARDLLMDISYSVRGAVQVEGNNFTYLGLTATPILQTPYVYRTETPIPSPTIISPPTPTIEPLLPVEPTIPAETPVESPVCGSTALILPVLAGVFWMAGHKRT